MKIKVTVWNEFRHEREEGKPKEIYPEGIHMAIKAFLDSTGEFEVKTATLDEPEHGLTDEVLDNTDVLIWWAHKAHNEVQDDVVEKVHKKVLKGMGLIVLHSGHHSKIFKKLMGTSCNLKWREANDNERLWVTDPAHPIVEGIGEYIELENEEMYGEFFDIPAPDALVFIGWFKGGEVFRSGCCFNRGYGRIFYFQPGHETYPTYYNKDIQKVIINAAKWANPTKKIDRLIAPNIKEPLEKT
ncbi:MAG: trehalose utilization protein ThuA [Clostridiaceae bacterium]|nr:trehalose utilization protein ThuA [Clostridiaceae bacterium]